MPAIYEVEVNGKRLKAEVNEVGPNTYKVRVGGSEFIVKITSAGVSVTPAVAQQAVVVTKHEQTTETSSSTPAITSPTSQEITKPAEVKGKEVKVEVPGKVLKVMVSEGQEVRAGDTVVTIESMKMELEIKAAVSGKVVKLLVKPGDSVNTGDTVAVIQPEA